MQTNLTTIPWATWLSGALGVAATFFALAYLVGMQVPLVSTDRAAFLALAATGFAMCTLSMGRTTTRLGWTHPLTLVGTTLGVFILLLVVAVLAGWRLPLVPTDRAAFVLIAVLGLAKWGLGLFVRLYLKV